MKNLEIKQILELNNKQLDRMTTWMYEWWGKDDGLSVEEVQCFLTHSIEKDRLPQTYGLFLNGKIIGMYQFSYNDLEVRPDIYPWLANVYIDKKYRNKGYARYMLNSVKDNARKKLSFNELFLYTKHIDFYEKFGWKFVSDFDTFKKNPRIQRLYKLRLK